ncbi:sulfate permease protein [Rutstroemia sp. NJR-2017a BBW]|nr:sulfate permease protein [Rutstroemia sp. NJR-2017a BBW]
MNKIAQKLRGLKEGFLDDENFTRARRGIVRGVKDLPSGAARYSLQKFPAIQWLPRYSPRWLLDDIIAGITVALVLVPQALGTAALAGVPLQDGLFASWLPSAIYFFMGTSKDLATGPTTSLGLLTGVAILSITAQGLPIPPAVIAAALSFSIGAISLVVGLLRLGWVINFVTVPMLVGFQMTSALILVQGQVPVILGESDVSTSFIQQGTDILLQIKTTQPLSLAIGVASIVLLIALKLMGKHWAHKSSIVRVLSNTRNAVVIVIFTGVSFIINKDLSIPQFPIAGKFPQGIRFPQPPTQVVLLILTRAALPVFIAAASEHLIFTKTFSRRNHYEIDPSQELVSLGIMNVANGAFGGMPVAGSLSLSAVNSTTGVRSPLGGLFTSAIVLLAIHRMTEVFRWIPNAAVGAVILMSVAETLPSNSIFITYWKGSFADFVGFFIVMNIGIATTPETGLGLGVVYMIFYTLIRTMFSSIAPVDHFDIENKFSGMERLRIPLPLGGVPRGTQIVSLETPIIFVNAEKIKKDIIDAVWTNHEPTPSGPTSRKVWNENRIKRTAFLRRKNNINTPTRYLPRLEILIIDLTRVPFIDTSGLTLLQDLKYELMIYTGDSVEIRFVGMNAAVRKKFDRIRWPLGTWQESQIGLVVGIDITFEDIRDAAAAPRSIRASMNGLDFGFARNDMQQDSDDEAFQKGMMNIIVTNVMTKDGRAYKEEF